MKFLTAKYRHCICTAIVLLLLIYPIHVWGNEVNKNHYDYMITKISPRTALIKVDGKAAMVGSKYRKEQTLELPPFSIVQVYCYETKTRKVCVGEKVEDVVTSKPFLHYMFPVQTQRTATKGGVIDIDELRSYFKNNKWYMIEDTTYISLPIRLAVGESIKLVVTGKLAFIEPQHKSDSNEIILTKFDLVNAGVFSDETTSYQMSVVLYESPYRQKTIADTLIINYIKY